MSEESTHSQIRDLINRMFTVQKFWEELKLTNTVHVETKLTKDGQTVFRNYYPSEKFIDEIIEEALSTFSKTKSLESLFTGKDIIIALLIQKVIQEITEINEELVKLGAPPFEIETLKSS